MNDSSQVRRRRPRRPITFAIGLALSVGVALPSTADEQAKADPHLHESHEGHTDEHRHDPPTDYDEVIVTGAPIGRRRFDVIQGSSVLYGASLERALQSSLGETLSQQPGISSTYYGAAASRPVVRGLDGPRIRVLQNGLGSLDASVTSPDHAVTIDPLASHRVEIIRGAGTLMYGSGAIGGVINVEDGRIPLDRPNGFAQGEGRVLYGSAAQEIGLGAEVTSGMGPTAFTAGGFFRDTQDISIPGYAVSDALAAQDPTLPRGPSGTAENTASRSKGGNIGGSLIGEEETLGLSFGINDSLYGVPSEPGEEIEIDLQQLRLDALLRSQRDWAIFDETSVRVGWAGYEHTEFEGGSAGTQFESNGVEGRLDLVQAPWRMLDGGAGFQFLHREFETTGTEAFIPKNTTNNFGLFAVEQLDFDPIIFDLGLRYEHQSVDASRVGFDRRFDTISVSGGASWEFFNDYLLGFSVSRNERAPSAEELLSNGPHLATGGFDLGDTGLGKEAGTTVEGTLRKRHGRWNAGLNVYFTHFKDFIYLQNQGLVDDTGSPDPAGELMLRQYVQADTVLIGGEIQAAVEAIQTSHFTGVVDAAFDWVKGTVQNSSSDRLPRIPPMRIKAGVEARSRYADLRFEAWWVAEQDRTAAFELATDDYVMLNLYLTVHPFPDDERVTLIVQGRNLGDAEARVHSSFLKDRLPLPGREARIGMKLSF
jgi:iron complex outermembrane receptor protein